jgi:hypothetical protein
LSADDLASVFEMVVAMRDDIRRMKADIACLIADMKQSKQTLDNTGSLICQQRLEFQRYDEGLKTHLQMLNGRLCIIETYMPLIQQKFAGDIAPVALPDCLISSLPMTVNIPYTGPRFVRHDPPKEPAIALHQCDVLGIDDGRTNPTGDGS